MRDRLSRRGGGAGGPPPPIRSDPPAARGAAGWRPKGPGVLVAGVVLRPQARRGQRRRAGGAASDATTEVDGADEHATGCAVQCPLGRERSRHGSPPAVGPTAGVRRRGRIAQGGWPLVSWRRKGRRGPRLARSRDDEARPLKWGERKALVLRRRWRSQWSQGLSEEVQVERCH